MAYKHFWKRFTLKIKYIVQKFETESVRHLNCFGKTFNRSIIRFTASSYQCLSVVKTSKVLNADDDYNNMTPVVIKMICHLFFERQMC